MGDWTLECLRRAIIAGAITAIVLVSDAPWLKLSALVCLVVFVVFLLRNPDGWARRIAYICAMLGAGLLTKLGSAIESTGWFQAGGWLQNADWLVSLVVTMEKGSIWPGIGLLLASLGFGLLAVVWQSLKPKRSAAPRRAGPQVIPPWFKGQRDSAGALLVSGVVPIRNNLVSPRMVGNASFREYRVLDKILIRNLEERHVFRLVTSSPSLPPKRVEFSDDEAFEVKPGKWEQFDIEFRFTDRVGARSGVLGLLSILTGLNRRYFEFQVGATQGEVHTTEVILVKL